MKDWQTTLVLIGLLLLVVFLVERRYMKHMRREVVKSVWSRRTGGNYQARPWGNSGWGIVAIVVLLTIILVVVVA